MAGLPNGRVSYVELYLVRVRRPPRRRRPRRRCRLPLSISTCYAVTAGCNAAGSRDALRAAHAQRPEVGLLDIGLPGMDGYELAGRLRQQAGLERTVLVALTGWGQEEDRRRSQEAGFAHHMVKPVDLSALQELLAEAQPTGTSD